MIEKPFHPSVFLIRVDAVFRQVALRANDAGDESTLTFAEGVPVARFGGKDLGLTPAEFILLRELWIYRGRVVSYASLNARVLGDVSADSMALKGHVSSLRRKLCAVGADPDDLQAVRGEGYSIDRRRRGSARPALNGGFTPGSESGAHL